MHIWIDLFLLHLIFVNYFFNVIGSRFKQLVAISRALVVAIKFVTLAQGKAAPARLDVFNQC
jgi:hypothetical protein